MAKPKYPQADGRAVAKLKRAVQKLHGPTVYFAEKVLKRMIKAGFDCLYQIVSNGSVPHLVRFVNALGPSSLFFETLERAVQIIARALRVVADLHGDLLALRGSYDLLLYFRRPLGGVWLVWGPDFVMGEVGPTMVKLVAAPEYRALDDPPF